MKNKELDLLRLRASTFSIIERQENIELEKYWKWIFNLYGFDFNEYTLIVSQDNIDLFIDKVPYTICNVKIVSDFSFGNKLLFHKNGNFEDKKFVSIL